MPGARLADQGSAKGRLDTGVEWLPIGSKSLSGAQIAFRGSAQLTLNGGLTSCSVLLLGMAHPRY